MTRRQNPTMPRSDFGFLLVEGGDESALCRNLAGASHSLCCWKVDGRDFVPLAQLAKNDPNFRFARSIGVVLDVENDLAAARAIAQDALNVFGATESFVHGELTGSPRMGTFLLPNDQDNGAIETLCRRAVRDQALATCTDALVACAGQPPHAANVNARANEDKGWLRAYLGMISPPDLRFHQALEHPQGIDLGHDAFAPLRAFVSAL
jgi:hypothetical protein